MDIMDEVEEKAQSWLAANNRRGSGGRTSALAASEPDPLAGFAIEKSGEGDLHGAS